MSNLIQNVFTAARNEGKQQTISVDAIKAAVTSWDDKANVTLVGDAYKRGRLCAALSLKGEAQAIVIFDLKPHKDGAGDDTRTLVQHMACRAAISAWSNIRMRAGAPSAQTGDKRKPRSTKVAEKDASKVTPVGFEPAITKATSVQDVHAYALRMASNVLKYVNASPQFVTGEVGDVLRGFVADARKAVKASRAAVDSDKAKAA